MADISCVAANIWHVAANISCVVANILRVVADKAVKEAKSCWPMKIFSIVFENFSKFFGFSIVKIHYIYLLCVREMLFPKGRFKEKSDFHHFGS